MKFCSYENYTTESGFKYNFKPCGKQAIVWILFSTGKIRPFCQDCDPKIIVDIKRVSLEEALVYEVMDQ